MAGRAPIEFESARTLVRCGGRLFGVAALAACVYCQADYAKDNAKGDDTDTEQLLLVIGGGTLQEKKVRAKEQKERARPNQSV